MIKINKETKEVSREALPQFLQGLKQESLNDLSWTDKSLGVQDNAWFDEQDITVYDSNLVLDGTESFEIDLVNHLVKVTKGQRVKTVEELELERKARVPQVITMRQARLALLNTKLFGLVDNAIATGSDEVLKVEWEYATEVRRDWSNLISMALTLGITEEQLDNLFTEGARL